MNLKKILMTALIVCLAVSFSFAVEQYGVLAGLIKDTEGNPLPGVEVSVKGPTLQGVKTAFSNERGFFRIPLLPVGKDYEATYALPGFKRVVWPGIVIELGKTFNLDIVMEITTIEEEITVTAKSPVVDMKSSTSQVTISKALVETLANDRQYQTIMGLMPGAIDANNPFMFGASGSDNMYLFDGMDSTDPMTKTWSTAMNFDNFEEMQIIISGAPAEYGKGTGAVINIVTKSGGNRFSGMARFMMTDVEWNAKAQGDRYFFSDATHYLTEKRPAVNFGGPVMKDRLWFFLSYEGRNKWIPGAVYQDYEDWLDLTPTSGLKSYYTGHYISGKLTFRPHAKHTIMAQYMEDPIEIPKLYEYLGYNYVSPTSDLIRFQGGWNVNSEWTAILGANTYVSLRFSMKRNDLNNEPAVIGTTYYRGGVYYGGAVSSYYTERFHEQYQLNLNHFAETGFGFHDIKVGVEFLDIRLGRYSQSYPGNEFIRLHYDAAATPMLRYVYPDRPQDQFTQRNYNRLWTLFIQDKWEVFSNLTLNIGLRAEMGQWKNHDKTTILDWGLLDMFAPRIGAAYNLKGTKLHANWGRFYDLYGDWIIQNNQPNIFTYTYDYYQGAYYGVPTWTLIRSYTTGGVKSSTINPDIKPSYMDELGVGVEHMLSDVVSVGLDLMTRSWKQRVEDFDHGYSGAPYNNPDLDGVWHFDNATFPDWGSTYKRYRAAIVTFKKNLGADKYQFMASYTLSDLKGYEDTDADGGWGDGPVQDYNKFGYLGNDIRHMIKFSGNYFLPYGFNIGSTFYWFNGTPYTETGSARWTNNVFYTYYIDPRGSSGRYPSTWRLDFRLEKKFTFFNRVNLSAYMDIFNILNNQVEIVRNNSVGQILLDGYQLGGNYTVTTPNLNYGRYTQWYPPMSFFVGVKLEF